MENIKQALFNAIHADCGNVSHRLINELIKSGLDYQVASTNLELFIQEMKYTNLSFLECKQITQVLGLFSKVSSPIQSSDILLSTEEKDEAALNKYLKYQAYLKGFKYDNAPSFEEFEGSLMTALFTSRLTGPDDSKIPWGNTYETGRNKLETCWMYYQAFEKLEKSSTLWFSSVAAVYKRKFMSLHQTKEDTLTLVDPFVGLEGNLKSSEVSALKEFLRPLNTEMSAELVSVPKNPTQNRIIMIMPHLMVAKQLIYFGAFQKYVAKHGLVVQTSFGEVNYKVYFDDQQRQQENAIAAVYPQIHGFTIDLKSASDGLTHNLLKECMPELYTYIFPTLPKFVRAKKFEKTMSKQLSTFRDSSGGYEFPVAMGMGMLFTFPLESLIFLHCAAAALSELHDEAPEIWHPLICEKLFYSTSVYGDDISCAFEPKTKYEKTNGSFFVNSFYSKLVKMLGRIGFLLNEVKTCEPQSAFKEACGVFAKLNEVSGIVEDIRPLRLKGNPKSGVPIGVSAVKNISSAVMENQTYRQQAIYTINEAKRRGYENYAKVLENYLGEVTHVGGKSIISAVPHTRSDFGNNSIVDGINADVTGFVPMKLMTNTLIQIRLHNFYKFCFTQGIFAYSSSNQFVFNVDSNEKKRMYKEALKKVQKEGIPVHGDSSGLSLPDPIFCSYASETSSKKVSYDINYFYTVVEEKGIFKNGDYFIRTIEDYRKLQHVVKDFEARGYKFAYNGRYKKPISMVYGYSPSLTSVCKLYVHKLVIDEKASKKGNFKAETMKRLHHTSAFTGIGVKDLTVGDGKGFRLSYSNSTIAKEFVDYGLNLSDDELCAWLYPVQSLEKHIVVSNGSFTHKVYVPKVEISEVLMRGSFHPSLMNVLTRGF